MFALGICFYLLLTLIVGILCGRRVKTLEDYLVAGRKLPVFLALPTIVATWYGAATCIGISGCVYSEGCRQVIADPFGCSLALLIAGFFFAGKFREKKLLTIADLLRNTYGRGVEVFATLLTLPFYIGVIASEMVALGFVWHLFTGLNPYIGMYLGTLAIVIYTTIGGLWAVTVTDLLQLFFLVLSLVLIFPFCVDTVVMLPGLSSIVKFELCSLLPREFCSSYLGKWMITGLGAVMGQELIQRILACRDTFTAKWSTISASCLYLFLGMIPILIGIAGPFLIPDLKDPELLIPLIAKHYFSPVVLALFMVGLLSAIMSTADSFMLAGTSLVMNNLLLPLLPNQKKLLFFTRITTIVIAVVALLFGIVYPHIYGLMVHSGAALFVCIFVPATAALYDKNATKQAAWMSMLFGLCTWLSILGWYSAELRQNYEELLYSAALWGGVASLVGYVLYYPLTAVFFTMRSVTPHITIPTTKE